MFTGQVFGRLGADPQQKILTNSSVATGSVAVSRRVAGGDRHTEWVTVEVWGKYGESFARHAKKGDFMALSGEVFLDTWISQDGQQKTKIKIRADKWCFAGSGQRSSQKETSEPIPDEIPF